MIKPAKLKSLYQNGKNITEILRKEKSLQNNIEEIIEISYDLQTGSYIQALKNPAFKIHKEKFTSALANIIISLCDPKSILESGVGEATTLSGVLDNLDENIESYGFDLSWSRVAFAKNWLAENGYNNTILSTGSLFNIPFADNSIDVVYTSHAVEPNGGNEKPILQELFRVTNKFLILLEPGYELASFEARQRMDSYGYCKNLKVIAEQLGYKVLVHKLFDYSSNPLNPTAITIIEKSNRKSKTSYVLACPKFKTPLENLGNIMFSSEALVAYPVLGGIPCLRIENGILASKYKELIDKL